jgi:hypothetical protein
MMRFFMADFLLGNKEKSNRDFAILAVGYEARSSPDELRQSKWSGWLYGANHAADCN